MSSAVWISCPLAFPELWCHRTETQDLVATVACDCVLSVFTCSPHVSTLKQRLIRCGSWWSWHEWWRKWPKSRMHWQHLIMEIVNWVIGEKKGTCSADMTSCPTRQSLSGWRVLNRPFSCLLLSLFFLCICYTSPTFMHGNCSSRLSLCCNITCTTNTWWWIPHAQHGRLFIALKLLRYQVEVARANI